jgi:hypothetical protein
MVNTIPLNPGDLVRVVRIDDPDNDVPEYYDFIGSLGRVRHISTTDEFPVYVTMEGSVRVSDPSFRPDELEVVNGPW